MDFSLYKGIYVIGALVNGGIQKVTGELVGEARLLADELGETVHVVLVGGALKDDPASLIPLGADKVYVLTHKLLSHYDGKAYQKALASFLKDRKPDTIIFASTSFGRDLAPRLAAELVCGVTADVTELSADKEKRLVIWSRPAMDGNIMADIVSPLFRPQVGTVRPGIFKYPKADESRRGTVEEVPVTLDEEDLGTVLKSIIQGEKDENPVETAKVIVAGGRGFHSREEWEMVHELADLRRLQPPHFRTGLGTSQPPDRTDRQRRVSQGVLCPWHFRRHAAYVCCERGHCHCGEPGPQGADYGNGRLCGCGGPERIYAPAHRKIEGLEGRKTGLTMI